jgi:hypothetical protein
MSDKSPRQSLGKKSEKSIKQKRAIKKAKSADDPLAGASSRGAGTTGHGAR